MKKKTVPNNFSSDDDLSDVTVELIVMGFEWECPHCNHNNTEPWSMEQVECENCGENFKVSGIAAIT